MNSELFLKDQQRYFSGAYEQFCAFGGPCVYFHRECMLAGDSGFLSDRHLEMLYATLTAWGMHRMGDSGRTKTKLVEWVRFRDSLLAQAAVLESLRSASLLDVSEAEYAESLETLESCYRNLKLTASGATIVVNSKALFHVLPRLVPPIDRQYTVRFFRDSPENWRYRSGKFKSVSLPANLEEQIALFRLICKKTKWLADRIESSLLDRALLDKTVTAPKAIDNAIVNFVRLNSRDKLPVM